MINPIILGSIFAAAGVVMGWLLFRKKYNSSKKESALRDPEVLAAALQKHGKIYDLGEEIEVSVTVNELTGHKELSLIKRPLSKSLNHSKGNGSVPSQTDSPKRKSKSRSRSKKLTRKKKSATPQ